MRDCLKGSFKFAFALSLGLMFGCVSRPVAYVESSIPVEQGKYTVLGSEVTGTYRQVSLLFLSFGLSGSSQRHAINDALEKVNSQLFKGSDGDEKKQGADALIGMAVDTESFEILPFLCPIIGFYSTKVTGIPVKTHSK